MIMLGVFAIIFVYFWFIYRPGEKKKEQEEVREKKVFTINSKNIEEITIENFVKNIEMSFRRLNEKDWEMVKPISCEADRYSVEAIASRLENLEIDRVVEEFPFFLKPYGLLKPRYIISLKAEGYPEPLSLAMGNVSPIGYKVYVRRSGDPAVFLVSKGIESLISKSISDYRKKRIMDFIAMDVKKLYTRYGENEFEIERKGDKWYFTKPKEVKASEEKVTSLISKLTGIKVDEFVSDVKKPNLRKFGLTRPYVKIVAELKDGRKYNLILAKKGKKVYGKREERPNIFSFKPNVLKDIRVSFEDFRERRVFQFYTWRAKALNLDTQGGVIRVVKAPKENKWYYEEAGKSYPADSTALRNVLRELSDLQVKKFIKDDVEPEEYISVRMRVSVELEGEGEPKVLLIGEEGRDGILGAVAGEKSVYLFDKQLSELTEKIEKIKREG